MTKLIKDLFHEKMEAFQYERQELPKSNINLRSGICDVVMKSKKRTIILEVQNKNLVERIKYYSSGFYSSQNSGDDYKQLLPVEVFLIINFPFGEPQVLKEYEELEKELKEQFGNFSKIKIWNIGESLKMKKGIDYDYARLFTLDDKKKNGEIVLEELEKKEDFKELVKEIRYYNLDEETYKKLKEIESMEMTFEQATVGFLKEGIEIGKQQGIEIGEKSGKKVGKLETAISMLKEGLEMPFIERVTGLTEKQILNYKKELSKN